MTVTVSKQKQKTSNVGEKGVGRGSAAHKLQIKPQITKLKIKKLDYYRQMLSKVTTFLYPYGGWGGGGMAQRLENRMRSKISLCITSSRVVRGASPGKILKTKNAWEAISGHLQYAHDKSLSNLPELCLFADVSEEKVPIYSMLLNVFEAGCAYRLVSRQARVRFHARHSFVEIWLWKKFYDHSLLSADSRRAVASYWRKNVH